MDIVSYDSPIGRMVLAAKDDALVGCWLEKQKYYMRLVDPGEITERETPILRQAKEWLDDYFKGKKPSPNALRLEPMGSPFQQKVWKILLEIPYGQVTTYGDIAKRVAREQGKEKMCAQAIGSAVGHNPIGVIIPCHRVVGTGGNLTGYAGGLERKWQLLLGEGMDMSAFSFPKEKGKKQKGTVEKAGTETMVDAKE